MTPKAKLAVLDKPLIACLMLQRRAIRGCLAGFASLVCSPSLAQNLGKMFTLHFTVLLIACIVLLICAGAHQWLLNAALRVMEVRQAYACESFEWDQLRRLVERDGQAANVMLLRGQVRPLATSRYSTYCMLCTNSPVGMLAEP